MAKFFHLFNIYSAPTLGQAQGYTLDRENTRRQSVVYDLTGVCLLPLCPSFLDLM